MKALIFIGLGGFFGSIARYLTGQFFARYVFHPLPAGTLVVNLVGALLIGLIIGLGEKYEWFSEPWHFFLAIGFCGSFTTFSTFAYENYILIKEGHISTLIVYIAISFILGMLLAWAGYEFGKWV